MNILLKIMEWWLMEEKMEDNNQPPLMSDDLITIFNCPKCISYNNKAMFFNHTIGTLFLRCEDCKTLHEINLKETQEQFEI